MTTILKKQIKQFAARFSFEDWSYLNSQINFLDAIESGDFATAEVIAHAILNSRLA